MTKDDKPVAIVGAGLAGLCCALRLTQAGVPCVVFEAGDRVGGRVATDSVDGFLLDRGFQVLLTAYPEAQARLDYAALKLRRFKAGALIRRDGHFSRIFDPRRHPLAAAGAALSPLLTVGDKVRLLRLWQEVRKGPAEQLLHSGPGTSTEEDLAARGFSDKSIKRFFHPFFGGIFLQTRLTTASQFFHYTFRMFSQGYAALPQDGMGQIPLQLARQLKERGVVIRLNTPVQAATGDRITLSGGEALYASAVVIATALPEAQRLTQKDTGEGAGRSRSACTLYFAADHPVVGQPTLVLNGDGPSAGPVNHLAEPSSVSPQYAPAGKALIAASVLENAGQSGPALESAVRRQLRGWYGDSVDKWRHLKTYNIPHALPPLDPPTVQAGTRPARLRDGLYICGDHRDHPSIQGAMVSGRRIAEEIVQNLHHLPAAV